MKRTKGCKKGMTGRSGSSGGREDSTKGKEGNEKGEGKKGSIREAEGGGKRRWMEKVEGVNRIRGVEKQGEWKNRGSKRNVNGAEKRKVIGEKVEKIKVRDVVEKGKKSPRVREGQAITPHAQKPEKKKKDKKNDSPSL